MKIKTKKLEGAALDWAVAKAEGSEPYYTHEWMAVGLPEKVRRVCVFQTHVLPGFFQQYNPSTCWWLGGPIIERDFIALNVLFAHEPAMRWMASGKGGEAKPSCIHYGPTPLIAAMRCYCCSELGDEVEIPNELTEGEQA